MRNEFDSRKICRMALGLVVACGTCFASGHPVDIAGRQLEIDARLPTPLDVPSPRVRMKAMPGWGLLPYETRYAGAWAHAVAAGKISGSHRSDVIVVNDYYFSPTTDYRVFLFRPEAAQSFEPPLLYPYGQSGGNPSVAVVG